MFTPQFHIDEEVRQRQEEMERMARQDLAISMAGGLPSGQHNRLQHALAWLASFFQGRANSPSQEFQAEDCCFPVGIKDLRDSAQVKL